MPAAKPRLRPAVFVVLLVGGLNILLLIRDGSE
jgi:hypothetical protein